MTSRITKRLWVWWNSYEKILKTFEKELYEPISLKQLEESIKAFRNSHSEITTDGLYIDKKYMDKEEYGYYGDARYRILLVFDLYETDEEYAAKVGNRVTLKDQEGYWLVKTVSAPTLKEQVLNQQNKNRNPFLSIVKW